MTDDMSVADGMLRPSSIAVQTPDEYSRENELMPGATTTESVPVRRWLVVTFFSVAACLPAPGGPPLRADDVTATYFDQLRRRRLFGLAEGYCLERLSDKSLSPMQKTELTIELSKTFLAHAKYTSGKEQEDLWSRAAHVIDNQLLQARPGLAHSRLQLQRAAVPATQAEFSRVQLELFPRDQKLRELADAKFADAVTQLGELEKRLNEQTQELAKRKRRAPTAVKFAETSALLDRVRFELGLTLISRAKHAAAASAQRTTFISDAELLLRPLAARNTDEPLTWTSQVLLAQTSRLRGDLKQATRLLSGIEKARPPREILDRVVAEKSKLLLDHDRPADAAQLLIDYRRLRKRLPGELCYLKVKATAGLWEIAERGGEIELAAELLEKVAANVEWAKHEVGGYWSYRARLLLERLQEAQEYGGELAETIRAAKATYRAGDVEAAIEYYREAAIAAAQGGKAEIAAELEYTAASIQLQAGQFEAAADGFHMLAARYPQNHRAAGAHLLRAYCLGKLYKQKKTRRRRQAYTDALIAHQQKFADDPTAAEATWMLARLEEVRRQVTRALELYRQIPATHPRSDEARVAAARCFEFLLDRLRQLSRPTTDWESNAVETLTGFVQAFPPTPRSLNVEQAELAVRLARIRLNSENPDHLQADLLLERVLESHDPADTLDDQQTDAVAARWKGLSKRATQLRIVSLAGQRRFADAESQLKILSETSSARVLGILDGLTQLAVQYDATSRRGLGELQLQTAQELNRRRNELNTRQRKRLDHCLAQAYVATGQPRKAIGVYETLLEESPRNKQLLATVAELLVECGTAECLEKAKANWRRLESLENAGSTDWLNARYHVSFCSFRLGQYDDCRKLLAVTRLLYPQLGNESLRDRFEKLADDLDAARPR